MQRPSSPRDWIEEFFGHSNRLDDDSHSLPEAPPPSPSKDLADALAEAMAPETIPPRLNRPHLLPKMQAVPVFLSRQRLAAPQPPPQITMAQRQRYNQAQYSLYSGGGGGSGRRDELSALAKAAGKKKRVPTEGHRFITTKSKRVIKVPTKKAKTKGKKKGRKSLSKSWPSSRDSFSSFSMHHQDDYGDRQAERAEMERCDRK